MNAVQRAMKLAEPHGRAFVRAVKLLLAKRKEKQK